MTRRAWMLAWGFVALLFWGFWSYGLFDLDEGLYASAAGEMLQKHEWIVITRDDKPFFEKPILVYWTAMPLVKAGLPGEVALRLPSVLATIGTLVIVALFARKRFDDRVAFWSVLILSSSYLFMMLGRMFTPDALLILFMTAAFFSYWESLAGEWWWRLVSAACLAFAVLAKGPMPAVLLLILIAMVAWRMPETRRRMSRGWIRGFIIFIAIVSVWYVPVLLAKGSEFFAEFVIKQNLGRLQGTDTAHVAPFWSYVPIFFIALAPFSFLVFGTWRKARREPIEVYLWLWAGLVFLLFTISATKLPHYILPMFPPIAILLAKCGVESRTRMRFDFYLYGLVFGIACLVGIHYLPAQLDLLGTPLAVAGAVALTATMAAILMGALHGPILDQAAIIALPVCFVILILGPRAYWLATHYDSWRVALDARELGLPVIEYRTGAEGAFGAVSHPSISWYLQARTQKADTPEQLTRALGSVSLNESVLVVTRMHRFTSQALGASKDRWELGLLEDVGEYRLLKLTYNRLPQHGFPQNR